MPSPDAAPRTASHGALFIALGFFAIIYAAIFFVSSAIAHADTMRFQYESRRIEGRIEAVRGSHLLKNSSIAYQYADEDGNVYHSTDSYPFSDLSAMQAGAPIDIIYLPRLPSHSHIAATHILLISKLHETPWLMICGVAIGGLLSAGIGVGKLRREWQS